MQDEMVYCCDRGGCSNRATFVSRGYKEKIDRLCVTCYKRNSVFYCDEDGCLRNASYSEMSNGNVRKWCSTCYACSKPANRLLPLTESERNSRGMCASVGCYKLFKSRLVSPNQIYFCLECLNANSKALCFKEGCPRTLKPATVGQPNPTLCIECYGEEESIKNTLVQFCGTCKTGSLEPKKCKTCFLEYRVSYLENRLYSLEEKRNA